MSFLFNLHMTAKPTVCWWLSMFVLKTDVLVALVLHKADLALGNVEQYCFHLLSSGAVLNTPCGKTRKNPKEQTGA